MGCCWPLVDVVWWISSILHHVIEHEENWNEKNPLQKRGRGHVQGLGLPTKNEVSINLQKSKNNMKRKKYICHVRFLNTKRSLHCMMTSSWIVEYNCFEYYSCKLNCVYGPTFTQICCLNHMQIQQLSPIVPQRPNQIKSATHPNKQIVGPLTLVTMHVLFNLLI